MLAKPTIPYLKLALSCLLFLLLFLSLTQSIDKQAEAPLEKSFNRALITFGVVRSINAVISVVQGTEVAIEPAGVGVILTPGQILDPINDLIERFSWIVLAAGTSLGAQRILISIGTTSLAQLMVVVAGSLLFLSLWTPKLLPAHWRSLVTRLSLTVLLLRFLIPVVVLMNELVYDSFLDEQYQSSFELLEQTEQEVQALQAAENTEIPTDGDDGIFDAIGRLYDRTTQSLNVSARFSEYETKLENTSEQIINLIVVFILQTLVFPLLFLYLAIKFGYALVGGKFWPAPASSNKPRE